MYKIIKRHMDSHMKTVLEIVSTIYSSCSEVYSLLLVKSPSSKVFVLWESEEKGKKREHAFVFIPVAVEFSGLYTHT